VAHYARPAGFWIRVGAFIFDSLAVGLPLEALGFWACFFRRSPVLVGLCAVPALLYKPFMEGFCGATLGKMACRIKVIDAERKKLSLFNAYLRAFPFLMAYVVVAVRRIMLVSSRQFQEAASMQEASQVRVATFLDFVFPLVLVLVLVDCVTAAFTFRKRALHDLLAESYCVYKEL
jgi:uncharacterized RDD family membrane protein YckC